MLSSAKILGTITSCTVIGNSTVELQLSRNTDIFELIYNLCIQTRNQQDDVLFCNTLANTLLSRTSFCEAINNNGEKIFLRVPIKEDAAKVEIYTIHNNRKISRVFDFKK